MVDFNSFASTELAMISVVARSGRMYLVVLSRWGSNSKIRHWLGWQLGTPSLRKRARSAPLQYSWLKAVPPLYFSL